MTDIEQGRDIQLPCPSCGRLGSQRNRARHAKACKGVPDPTLTERFWSKVDKSGDCWEWTGAVETNHGYGRIRIDGRNHVVHRVAWEASEGPIPEGMVIDHVCRNRRCVKVSHLRVVTPETNVVENSVSPSALNAIKTHCTQGHEFTAENTYLTAKGRHCKECRRQAVRDYRERKRNGA